MSDVITSVSQPRLARRGGESGRILPTGQRDVFSAKNAVSCRYSDFCGHWAFKGCCCDRPAGVVL